MFKMQIVTNYHSGLSLTEPRRAITPSIAEIAWGMEGDIHDLLAPTALTPETMQLLLAAIGLLMISWLNHPTDRKLACAIADCGGASAGRISIGSCG